MYERPMIGMIAVETCSICAGSEGTKLRWAEYPSDSDSETEPSTWGPIHYDDGTIDKKNDPFDSENW